jgi:4-aminobutyrate aminotransferase-like enzyme
MTRTPLRHSNAAELIENKRRHIWPCVFHFYQDPPILTRGKGAYLYDDQENRYLDCYSGVGVTSAGHGNREILDAVTLQVERLVHTTTIYITEPMLELSERLSELLPGDLDTSFFCASGSEANEAAILLATLATGRSDLVTFELGLHGRTKAAMSATALPMWRTDPSLLDTVHHAPKLTDPNCLIEVRRLLERFEVAAVMLEPIQGNGGIQVPPKEFLPELKRLCEKFDTLLIADEVQTGINRTGTWLACEHSNVQPDIVTLAKGLGNGFPIAAAVTSHELAAAYSRPGASTFGGNPVSAAAALAVLRFHEQHKLGKRSRELGELLMCELQSRLRDEPCVGEIRGRGLMIGIDVQTCEGTPDADRTGLLLESLKDEGYLLGRTGIDRNVLTIMPPLVVAREALLELAFTLERAFAGALK